MNKTVGLQHFAKEVTGGIAALLFICLAAPLPAQQVAQPVPQKKKVEDVLSYADMLYGRDKFALAAQQYQIFIQEQPQSPNLQIAWFRLGECYLKAGQEADAITSFDFLIKTYQKGAFVGSGAYRLAVLRYNAGDFANALEYFRIAKNELTAEEAKLQARYYYARSLQLTKKSKEALAEFNAVIEGAPPEKNPFYERCLLETARLSFDLGETEAALEKFIALSETASNREIKEEAIVRGGLLASEVGQVEQSEKLLNLALRFSDTSPWKSLAQVGAIFNAFTAEDYQKVVGLYNTGAYNTPNESRAKLILIVGHSYRILGDLESALRLYSIVEAKFSDQKEGIEAGYRKLQILHQTGDNLLPEFASRFADKQRKVDPESSFIDMAYLMKAEWHFNQADTSASGPGSEFAIKHYNDAATAYKKVRADKIDEKYLEARLYKQGWSEIESDNRQDGILTLSRFIQRYSNSKLTSSALAKRAMAYQAQDDHQFALGDYQDLAKRFPDAPEAEFAMQQVALILAHERKIPEMIAAYEALLEKFPETDGAGEAHYWIGVGKFDLEDYKAAVPELKKARDIDPDYDDKATLRTVIALYQLEDVEALSAETKRYLDKPALPEGEKRASLPPQIIDYLGRKLSAGKNFKDAEYFLTAIADVDKPKQTSASVWRLLAEARMELKKHREAINAFDQYLLQTEKPSERASAYLERGQAQYCLRDFKASRQSAQESLRSQKEGRTNAEARLLLGDIAAAEGDLEQGLKEYLIVSQIFMDPQVTPKALLKTVNAYRSLGNQAKAEQLNQELTTKFPNYKAPASLDPEC
ncbi:tetratricopeptide repeat protein [Verrucomicrobiales bacterium]|nr:tetratricopeptide repeat protein [Verrucomicrobiales bacterium]